MEVHSRSYIRGTLFGVLIIRILLFRVLYSGPLACFRQLPVISGIISPLIWVITIVILLITPLITTHEAPSGA